MIRVVIYLLIVAAFAFGAVWLADRPGEVAITWQGRRIDTSVMVLVMAVVAVAAFSVMLWSAIRAIIRSPGLIARYIDTRRGVRGYRAVSQGLVAVGSGDARAARKFTDEAKRIAPHEPLTLLLSAQTAQLSGDRGAAASTFLEMAGRDDTKLLGLHGLFIEARRRGDPAAALLYAEEAAKHASIPPWAGQAVLEFRCVAGDWSGALERLERNHKGGLVDKAAYRRQRAVLLTAQALALEDGDRDRSKALVLEAVKLAPTLVPAAALAGRFLAEGRGGSQGRAHHRGRLDMESASRPCRRLCGFAAGRFRARKIGAHRVAGGEVPRPCRGGARGGARRHRRQRIRRRTPKPRAAHREADQTCGGADGRARADAGR